MSEEISCTASLAIVLPSLDPDAKFALVVRGLADAGFKHIVIIDDGSAAENQRWFNAAEEYPQCHVLHHGVNKGKGRALKTAFEYVLSELPDARGVITIDGDGQHLTGDIIACGERMLSEGDKIVLGCRNFSDPVVPQRNAAGNKMTARLFHICYGIRISDTQTGLRAIPRQYLRHLCEIDGERFEYETNMLLMMKRLDIGFVEQPIATVYDPDDYSSHYNVLKDSWRIFKVMFKFLLSSASSLLVDLLLFYLVMKLFGEQLGRYAELAATVAARVCSSFFNFNANNRVVFNNSGSYKRAMLRYYCLCIPQMLVSAGLVTGINMLLSNSVAFLSTLIKLAVDTVLFFISYRIQREWVFSQK